MRLLFLASLFHFSSCLSAQIQWFTPDARWDNIIDVVLHGFAKEKINLISDTVHFAGQVYQTVSRTTTLSFAYDTKRHVRQEGCRIYALSKSLPALKTESFLMYDFELKVGDTIFLPRYFAFSSGFGYVINAVDSISINGLTRRTQEVKWISPNSFPIIGSKSLFIEGIGNVSGSVFMGNHLFLDEPPKSYVDGTDRQFCSFSNNSGYFFGTPGSYCYGLSSIDNQLFDVKISPNPTTGVVYLQGLQEDENLRYELRDVSGHLIGAGKVVNQSIGIGYTGLCFLQICNEHSAVNFKIMVIR